MIAHWLRIPSIIPSPYRPRVIDCGEEEFERSRYVPPDCRVCQYHFGQEHGGNHLTCAVHPKGWLGEGKCPDQEKVQFK